MYQQVIKSSPEQIFSSRISMLNAIYEAAVTATQEAATVIAEGHGRTAVEQRTRALSLVGLIESGLQPNGELPDRIRELCHYVQQCLLTRDADKIRSAAKVLRNLHEGFQGIQSEAARLERNGELPPLQTVSLNVLV